MESVFLMLFVCPGEKINHSPGKLYTEKCRETGGANSLSLNVLLPCSAFMYKSVTYISGRFS